MLNRNAILRAQRAFQWSVWKFRGSCFTSISAMCE